jgi:hypothetical protein
LARKRAIFAKLKNRVPPRKTELMCDCFDTLQTSAYNPLRAEEARNLS